MCHKVSKPKNFMFHCLVKVLVKVVVRELLCDATPEVMRISSHHCIRQPYTNRSTAKLASNIHLSHCIFDAGKNRYSQDFRCRCSASASCAL